MDIPASQSSPRLTLIDVNEKLRRQAGIVSHAINAELLVIADAQQLNVDSAGPQQGAILLNIDANRDRALDRLKQATSLRQWHPIITVSASTTAQISADSIKHGAVDFLSMPCDVPTLQRSIQTALEHSQELLAQRRARKDFEILLSQLSPRETEVYDLLLQGQENKQIALRLKIAASTVEKHRLAVVRKMEVQSVTHLLVQKFQATGTLGNEHPLMTQQTLKAA